MPSFTNKMPPRPLLPLLPADSDGFSYTQSGSGSPNHYHDIESLKLTVGKGRSGRKTSREKSTIWTESSEVEKERTTNTGHKKSKSINNSTTLPHSVSKPKSSKKEAKASKQLAKSSSSSHLVPVSFLENPLLQVVDQNWTLPRVELWCRDPECVYNQRLWGNHYTYQHHSNNPNYHSGSGFAIPEVDEGSEVYLTDQTDQTPSAGYYTRSSSNNSSSGGTTRSHNPPNHFDIHSAATMVLNPHGRHGSKGGGGGGGGRGPTPLTAREQMHLNMSMGINNFGTKDGITITHTNNTNSKADNTFTNSTSNGLRGKGNSGSSNGMMTMTQTPMDTIGSSISSSTSNSNTTDSSTILTIHTETTGSSGILGLGESSTNRSTAEGFSASTFLTGFDSSTSTSTTGSGAGSSTGLCKPVGHDIVNLGNHRNNNGNNTQCVYSSQAGTTTNNSSAGQYQQGFRPPSTTPPANPYCPNCSGVVPLNHLDNNGPDQGRLKGDPGFWQFNKFQHPLQRDHSFHSVGGFTLNGQYNTTVKKHTMVKFCSSHKISLVVSTFSLLVTIGLLITLFLMKKRGMMDTMMDS